jgi:hypothetical protein
VLQAETHTFSVSLLEAMAIDDDVATAFDATAGAAAVADVAAVVLTGELASAARFKYSCARQEKSISFVTRAFCSVFQTSVPRAMSNRHSNRTEHCTERRSHWQTRSANVKQKHNK